MDVFNTRKNILKFRILQKKKKRSFIITSWKQISEMNRGHTRRGKKPHISVSWPLKSRSIGHATVMILKILSFDLAKKFYRSRPSTLKIFPINFLIYFIWNEIFKKQKKTIYLFFLFFNINRGLVCADERKVILSQVYFRDQN